MVFDKKKLYLCGSPKFSFERESFRLGIVVSKIWDLDFKVIDFRCPLRSPNDWLTCGGEVACLGDPTFKIESRKSLTRAGLIYIIFMDLLIGIMCHLINIMKVLLILVHENHEFDLSISISVTNRLQCSLQVWFNNVPHSRLVEDKGGQNWISIAKDKFKFPGGGTQFIHGADQYLDQISQVCSFPKPNGRLS